jgi:hypothetical protein
MVNKWRSLESKLLGDTFDGKYFTNFPVIPSPFFSRICVVGLTCLKFTVPWHEREGWVVSSSPCREAHDNKISLEAVWF